MYGFTVQYRIKENVELDPGSLYHVSQEVTNFSQLKIPLDGGRTRVRTTLLSLKTVFQISMIHYSMDRGG